MTKTSETRITDTLKRVRVTGTSKAEVAKAARKAGIAKPVVLPLRDDNGLPCYAKTFGARASVRELPVYVAEGYVA